MNEDMTTQTEPLLNITAAALEKILSIRGQELDEEEYALRVEVTGISGNSFTYELTFEPLADASEDDLIYHHGDLPVAISAQSARDLQGATLDLSRNMLDGGLVLDNPNTPSPRMAGPGLPPPDLSGPVAQRVAQLLDGAINPAIAAHGGAAQLVAVEEDTAYLRLSGGCQGCGMAQVTLRQGIENAIFQAVPEIKRVVDVTDHDAGTNPYFEAGP